MSTKGSVELIRWGKERGILVTAEACPHHLSLTDEMVEGYDKLRALAESPKHIIPGHDPLVMQRYPAPSKDLEGVVVRLDVPPVS